MRKLKLKETLLQLLNERDITVNALAKKTGVPPGTLHQWINKNSSPKNIEHVTAVADFFKVDLFYLMYHENDPNAKVVNVEKFFGSTEIFAGKFEISIKRLEEK